MVLEYISPKMVVEATNFVSLKWVPQADTFSLCVLHSAYSDVHSEQAIVVKVPTDAENICQCRVDTLGMDCKFAILWEDALDLAWVPFYFCNNE